MSLDFSSRDMEGINNLESSKKNLEKNHIMSIEYPDGTKHRVDCYKFAKAILEDGEQVYYIEYKDYDNKRDGEYTDSYSVIVNRNGRWQKSDRKIDYSKLSSREIGKYDPKALGGDLQIERLSNTQSYEQPEGILSEHIITIPQTQIQTQRDKKLPVGNSEEQNSYIISKEDGYVPQTQTQPLREEIPPHYEEKKDNTIVYIQIETDSSKKQVFPAFFDDKALQYCGRKNLTYHHSDDEEMVNFQGASELYYESEKNGLELFEGNVLTYDEFKIVELPKEVVSLICKQYDDVGIKDRNGFELIKYSDLKDVTVGNVIYKLVPVVNKIYLNYPHVSFDVFLNEDSKRFTPGEIIEHFCDDSLPIGRMNIEMEVTPNEYNQGRTMKMTKWVGYTKDVEIEKLRRECEYLRSMNKNYQAQMNIQDAIQDVEDRKAGVRR